MNKLRGGIAITLFALCAATATAEVYRWVDAEGRVHFGDRPPTEAGAKDVSGELKPVNRADATQALPSGAAQRSQNLEQQYESRRQQQMAEQRRQMDTACRQARHNLKILQGPVYFVDEGGREYSISEEERARRAAELEREIGRVCGG